MCYVWKNVNLLVLLIRRSLVRVQVGEPEFKRAMSQDMALFLFHATVRFSSIETVRCSGRLSFNKQMLNNGVPIFSNYEYDQPGS
jgi:hypothetical protein